MSMSIEKAKEALAAAISAYQDELRQDCERSEGSSAQERRREENLQSLSDSILQCKRDLEVAERNSRKDNA